MTGVVYLQEREAVGGAGLSCGLKFMLRGRLEGLLAAPLQIVRPSLVANVVTNEI